MKRTKFFHSQIFILGQIQKRSLGNRGKKKVLASVSAHTQLSSGHFRWLVFMSIIDSRRTKVPCDANRYSIESGFSTCNAHKGI